MMRSSAPIAASRGAGLIVWALIATIAEHDDYAAIIESG